MIKFANNEEIINAHSVLLNGKPEFEQDKIDVILCNESRDVKACPGSGKTTTLLAKLIILSNKMPLPDNQGICVLTHTNVAIDEIKEKLGQKADILFAYPNFFGTIQTFVNKFFAIPYYNLNFEVPLRYIDTEKSKFVVSNKIAQWSWNQKNNFRYNIKSRLSYENEYVALTNFVSQIWSDMTSTTPVYYSGYDSDTALFRDPNTAKYALINEVKYETLKEGILTYDDAYSLAFSYLQKYPQFKDAISLRFKYLFIDEMQDTDSKQLDLLNDAFDSTRTIVQRFGDHHQAIYNKVQKENLWTPSMPLAIHGSKRFGECIAKVLRTVCMENNSELKGEDSVSSIKPIMLVYTDPEKVLPKFAEIVKTKTIGGKSIHDIAKQSKAHKVKAIGWVGTDRNDNELTIKSYCPQYDKNVKRNERSRLDSLKSFLCKNEMNNLKVYSDSIIKGILQLLYTAECKYEKNGIGKFYSKTSFVDSFNQISENQYNAFRVKVASWAKKIHSSDSIINEEVLAEVRTYVKEDLQKIFRFDLDKDGVLNFIESDVLSQQLEEVESSNNTFTYSDVEIEVASVHSVKGETHIATLYLETYFKKKYESQRIAKQLIGQPYSDSKSETIQSLKMAYVGMSRPKYLLCMAVQKDRFVEHLGSAELNELWEVVHCVE